MKPRVQTVEPRQQEAISFPHSCVDVSRIGFEMPAEVNAIGNTPLKRLDGSNLFVKLEGHNPGESIKDRAITSTLLHMFASGDLPKTGGKVCICTSGWAGMSIMSFHDLLRDLHGVDMTAIVVIPKDYAEREIPAAHVRLGRP